MIRWSIQMFQFLFHFKRLIFGQVIGQKRPNLMRTPIYGHTFFGHNLAIFRPISNFKISLNLGDWYLSDKHKKSLIKCIFNFFVFWGQKWAWPPGWRLRVWVLKTECKSCPNRCTFWINHYLKIMFLKFHTLEPPLNRIVEINQHVSFYSINVVP